MISSRAEEDSPPRTSEETPGVQAALPKVPATIEVPQVAVPEIEVPEPPPSAAPPSTQLQHWGLPLAVLVVGMFMSVLDTSIVNVAVPVIQKQFSVTTEQAQWITNSYSLCEGVVVPASAWLGERLGLRRLYIWSMIGFAIASALCGLSGNLETMVAFRILQAVPGGVIQVTCLTILYRLVPQEKLGAAMGLYGLGVVVAPGVGPSLGGYLVEYVDWRLIYYINVPIGVLGTLAAMVVLPHMPGARGHRFDLPGFVCIAGACFALLLATSEGPNWGWTGYRVLILVAGAINLVALFIVIELQTDHPLLDVRVFANWPFVNSIVLISLLSSGLFATVFYIPQFLQNGQGLTPWHTGLVLIPQALVMVVMMPVAGRLYDRFGPRWPAVFGMLVAGGGSLLLSQINYDMTRSELIWWLMVWAGGLGLGMMPVMTGGISALPAEIVNSGSALSTLTQRVSAALGLALLTSMSTTQQAQFMADRSALLSGVGPDVDPRILAMEQQGPAGLIPLWQHLKVEVQAEAYSNIFLVAGLFSLAGAALALLFLRSGPTADAEKPMVH
jgi:EmrB/QacA subfamily drug resistance transporter